MNDLLQIPIADLKFSRRLYNCLTANGIRTLGDLIECTEIDLLKLPGLGRVCFAEAKAALDERGLKFVPWPVRRFEELLAAQRGPRVNLPEFRDAFDNRPRL